MKTGAPLSKSKAFKFQCTVLWALELLNPLPSPRASLSLSTLFVIDTVSNLLRKRNAHFRSASSFLRIHSSKNKIKYLVR